MAEPVTILTSGVGLGVYMPALFIRDQLRARAIAADVEVLEGYFTEAGQARHLAHKQAYHDSFELAQLAHRMARSVETSLDEPRITALLQRWVTEARTRFVVWSGFWLPVLARYQAMLARPLAIERCRIDAVESASFRVHHELWADAPEIWLWSWERRRTEHEIAVDARPPVDYAARALRLVVHGGGWGLGGFRAAATALPAAWACDVVVHAPGEAEPRRAGDRYFMVDATWRPWHQDRGEVGYPPFRELGKPDDPLALYDRIRQCRAILSKPGGGTLIDSLSAETPVILLEPYGYAEAKNGALWQELGFGIPFATWRDDGFRPERLAELHANLRGRGRGTDYPRAIAAQVHT